MPTILDTRRLPRVDRTAAAVAFLSATYEPSAWSFDEHEQLGHLFTSWSLAHGARIVDIAGSGLRVTRKTWHVRAVAPERLCLAVQFRGQGRSEHRGVITLTPPGHLNLIDCTSESDYLWTGFATKRLCLVDYATLGLPVEVVREAVGKLPASPLHDLVRSHLSSLQPGHEDVRASSAGVALAAASVDLVRALIVSAAEASLVSEVHAHDILRMRIADFIEQHLSDVKLNAETIARAHHISLRHLYAVWSANPVSLREWIIRARLERARRELMTSPSTPVSAIAGRCGFANVTHFARRFREAYGMPPSEWRRYVAIRLPSVSGDRRSSMPPARREIMGIDWYCRCTPRCLEDVSTLHPAAGYGSGNAAQARSAAVRAARVRGVERLCPAIGGRARPGFRPVNIGTEDAGGRLGEFRDLDAPGPGLFGRQVAVLIFDSDTLPERDREDALNSVLCSVETPQSVTFNAKGPVHHRMESFEFGPGVHMLRNTGTAVHLVRNLRHVRRGTREELALFVQTRGQAITTGGGASFWKPGQLGAVDITRPYSQRQTGDSDINILLIEFDQLGLPVDTIRTAIPLLASSPVYRLVRRHLMSLTVDLPADAATMTGQATAELIAALVTTVTNDPRQHEMLEATEPMRIAAYIDECLGDAGLSIERIAAAHSMSVRRITNLWGETYNAAPADWIARRRLERVWRLLTDPKLAQATVDDNARACGFGDMADFDRKFRAFYGISPWHLQSRRQAPRAARTRAEGDDNADSGQ